MMKQYFKVKDRPEEIKVSVGYELGGWGMLSGEHSRRGYYVYVQPVTRGDGFESMTLFDGFKQSLKEVKRKSVKAEKEAKEKAERIALELAEKIAGNKGWELEGTVSE